jgi:hypothetical protein
LAVCQYVVLILLPLISSLGGVRQEVEAQDDLDAVPGDFRALTSGVRLIYVPIVIRSHILVTSRENRLRVKKSEFK